MQKLLSEKVDKHIRGQDHNSKLPSVDNVMKNSRGEMQCFRGRTEQSTAHTREGQLAG